MIYTKEELTNILKTKVISIKFTKSDGSIRDMKCTLLAEHIKPPIDNSKESRIYTKSLNEDRLVVWDIEKENFRSFNISSIIEVN